MNKNKKESSKDTVTIMQDSLTKITPHTMLQNKTITLNPIQTTPSFNPVQNLFDKLKQQMDEKYNRPGSSDVSKEILFSSESNADNQKGCKKSKKNAKKKDIFDRLVMPLLPSNASLTDNGYYLSTSNVNTKISDEVIVINEENGDVDDNDEEVLVNTGPMPNFVLRTASTERFDNDVIVINDRSTPTMDHIVIDDARSTRTSPRLKNDSNLKNIISNNNNNQEQTSYSNVITINDSNSSEMAISSSKHSSDKPRKRRTLLPSIPLNFFNTSMLLRSELAQKKSGGCTSRASTSKVQKSENKPEKPPLKQRKDKSDSKARNVTENLIYEVVKSSDHATVEKNNDAKNDVILIDNSPPKVEPLIIKLKVSQNKNSIEKSVQDVKNRSQKSEVAKITKNLFFPRLLRSDVGQQKPSKEKEDKKSAEVVPQISAPTSPRKSPIKLNVSKETVELHKKDVDKSAILLKSPLKDKPVDKISSNNKKTEKSPESQRRLRSDLFQDKITVDDGRETDETTCKLEDTVGKPDVEKIVIRKPRAQKKTDPEVILVENAVTNQEKPVKENLCVDQTALRQLRSKNSNDEVVIIDQIPVATDFTAIEAQKSTTDVDVINVAQFYTPVVKTDAAQKKSPSEKAQDDSNNNQPKKDSPNKKIAARRPLRSDLVQKEPEEKSNNAQPKSIYIEEPKKVPSKPKPTEIVRKLRSELAHKDDKIVQISDPDVRIVDADAAQEPSKSDGGSKSKRVFSRLGNLGIDLVDYANLSVDTATPRRLRSDFAQKCDGEEKSVEEAEQRRSEVVQSSVSKAKTATEKIRRTRSVTGIDRPVEEIKMSNKVEENQIKVEKNVSKVDCMEKPKRKYTRRVKNIFSGAGVVNTEVLGKEKRSRMISRDGIKNKDKPVERAAKKKGKATFKIKTVKKVFKRAKKSPPKAKINKKVFHVEIVPEENEVKVKVEKSDEIAQKTSKPKVTKSKSADENVAAVTKRTDSKLNGVTKKTTRNKIRLLRKISKTSTKVESEVSAPQRRGRKTKNVAEISTTVTGENAVKEIKKQPKIKLVPKKQDLDEITVVPEKRAKKQKDGPVRTLRSSFAPVAIKQEPPDEKPVIAVIEKVVALIHSEPKPKIPDERTETKPVVAEKTEKIKPRILRSQNFNQIETINDAKEAVAPKEAKKKDAKKPAKGVSKKSKVIAKNRKEAVAKNLRSDSKSKKASKKETPVSKKAVKAKGGTEPDRLTKNSKKKIVRQVKSKLKTAKVGPKKKPAVKNKMMLNWRNDDIIERIIQELKNSIFNKDGAEDKNVAPKKGKKKVTAQSTTKNKKKLLLAKKKLLQTKAALQRKLRSARSPDAEANTSGGSESKENSPPKPSIQDALRTKNEDSIKEETTVHLVDAYLEEIKDNEAEKRAKSINIINDVTVQTNGKIVKRKYEDAAIEPTVSKRRQYKSIKGKPEIAIDLASNPGKKNDITVFDFDESEPELPPLRHKSKPDEPTHTTPVKRPVTPTRKQISSPYGKPSETAIGTDKGKSVIDDDDINIVIEDDATPIKNERTIAPEASTSFQVDKDQILVDALPPNRNSSKKKPQILVPAYDDDGKPRKLWSVIKPVEPASPIQCVNISNLRPSKDADDGSEAPEKKSSPLKQATIIEMFSKAWRKRDRDLFAAPKVEPPANSPIFADTKPPASPKAAASPRRDRPADVDDDDSDTESRIEWIPEEYAEYKLKYSVQKMMQYKPVYKCKICQVMMPTYYKLLKHRKVHDTQDRPHVCPQCGSEFREVEDFSAHLRVHKGKHPYMCHKCDLGFWTKKAFEAHAAVHVLRKVKQPVKKFRCDVCTKEFSKLCDVERHTRVHTGEKPCVCNICNKGFVQAHNLSKHLLTHLHIKPFVCEICNKQFGRNDVLRRHLLTHSVQKPIKCSVCDRGFIRQSQLLQHMRKKHPGHSVEGLGEASDDEGSIKNEDGVSSEDGNTVRVKS